MPRILGIDYGTKRVGIAISSESQSFALPKVVLVNDKKLVSNISEICAKENVEKIILGESKNYKMENNKVMVKILEFKKVLEIEVGKEVIFEPEFMTSAEAERIQGKNDMLDASAAALILKSYLEKRK